MAQLPKPKILPKVTYDPPSGPPDPQDVGRAIRGGTQGAWDALLGLGQYGYNLGQDLGQGLFSEPKVARPDYGPQKVAYPDVPLGPPTPTAPWDARAGAGVDSPYGGGEVMGPPSPTKDQWDMVNKGGGGTAGAGDVMGPPSPTAADWQGTLNKNRNLYNQAAAGGDSAAMARLDAEWNRIAPMAQQFGISKERIVNSYMQPGNPAAKSDFNSALANAISDDVWANQATQAFGRPPTQQEWDEHWTAMNVGGRDPLEGHPQAVANIKATMQQMGQNNQQGVYNDLQQWLTKSGV